MEMLPAQVEMEMGMTAGETMVDVAVFVAKASPSSSSMESQVFVW